PALLRNPSLDLVAAAWASTMATADALSHNPAYTAEIPGGWVSAAENVAPGQPTAVAMHESWIGSSGHRANILGDFTDVGVAPAPAPKSGTASDTGETSESRDAGADATDVPFSTRTVPSPGGGLGVPVGGALLLAAAGAVVV